MWALFKGDNQVTKAHSTKQAAIIEAYERGVITRGIADFPGQMRSNFTIALDADHSIREVNQ